MRKKGECRKKVEDGKKRRKGNGKQKWRLERGWKRRCVIKRVRVGNRGRGWKQRG